MIKPIAKITLEKNRTVLRHTWDVVAYTCIPSTEEDKIDYHREFQANVVYRVRPCLKIKDKTILLEEVLLCIRRLPVPLPLLLALVRAK